MWVGERRGLSYEEEGRYECDCCVGFGEWVC